MKVTLSKALVIKNRLVQEVSALKVKIAGANTTTAYTSDIKVVPEVNFEYDIHQLLEEYDQATNKLVATKIAISLANKNPDQQKRIFLISEYKAKLSFLSTIKAVEGISPAGYENNIFIYTTCKIKNPEKEKMIKDLQDKIDQLQEEMEKFNWSTEVEVPG